MFALRLFLSLFLVERAICNNWIEQSNVDLLSHNQLTSLVDSYTTVVWKECKCQEICQCTTEFQGWDNERLKFNLAIDPVDPPKFQVVVLDGPQNKTFHLSDTTCIPVDTSRVIDTLCFKPFANIGIPPFSKNVCLQMGVSLENRHALSLDYECFRGDANALNHTGLRFEKPNLTELNQYMFDTYCSAASIHTPSVFLTALLAAFYLIRDYEN